MYIAKSSIQSDPIPSEVSGRTDSTLEQVPAIVSELIDLVAAIGLPVDVHTKHHSSFSVILEVLQHHRVTCGKGSLLKERNLDMSTKTTF